MATLTQLTQLKNWVYSNEVYVLLFLGLPKESYQNQRKKKKLRMF
jgi:hypothetical protein